MTWMSHAHVPLSRSHQAINNQHVFDVAGMDQERLEPTVTQSFAFVSSTVATFARGEEACRRTEEAGNATGRKIKYQRLDEGLINIQGQLGLKRRESKKMPKKDPFLSLRRNNDYKKKER